MGKPKDWNEVDDILYDGTKEDVETVLCPDCGGKIQYRYSEEFGCFEIKSVHCGYISRAIGSQKPKCVDYFGNEYNWNEKNGVMRNIIKIRTSHCLCESGYKYCHHYVEDGRADEKEVRR